MSPPLSVILDCHLSFSFRERVLSHLSVFLSITPFLIPFKKQWEKCIFLEKTGSREFFHSSFFFCPSGCICVRAYLGQKGKRERPKVSFSSSLPHSLFPNQLPSSLPSFPPLPTQLPFFHTSSPFRHLPTDAAVEAFPASLRRPLVVNMKL